MVNLPRFEPGFVSAADFKSKAAINYQSWMHLGFEFEDIFDMLEANLHDETVRKVWQDSTSYTEKRVNFRLLLFCDIPA